MLDLTWPFRVDLDRRSSMSAFIVYLPATGVVQAGYVNRMGEVTSFFQGDPDGANCYFSIAMLNRTDEG